MRNRFRSLMAVAVMIPVISCSPDQSTSKANVTLSNQSTKPAPDFELENIAGGTLKSADLQGEVSVIDIWATWCEPCITEIPKFNHLYDVNKSKDVRIVGLTVVSPRNDIATKAKEFGIKYTVLVGNDEVVDAFGGVIGWPTTFVLTKDRQIYKKYVGALPDKETRLQKDIDTLLRQIPSS
jgi:thiol-disulfide isomerase/thioredoxin